MLAINKMRFNRSGHRKETSTSFVIDRRILNVLDKFFIIIKFWFYIIELMLLLFIMFLKSPLS